MLGARVALRQRSILRHGGMIIARCSRAVKSAAGRGGCPSGVGRMRQTHGECIGLALGSCKWRVFRRLHVRVYAGATGACGVLSEVG